MYLGRLVDLAPRQVFDTARLHPYTEALLAAVPLPDPARAFPPPPAGRPPSPLQIPSGLPFPPPLPGSRVAPLLGARPSLPGDRPGALGSLPFPLKSRISTRVAIKR